MTQTRFGIDAGNETVVLDYDDDIADAILAIDEAEYENLPVAYASIRQA